jgi:hypothetical protein
VAGGKRRYLVEEEKFGIAVAPDFTMPVIEIELAANPSFRHPTASANFAVMIVQPSAPIAHKRTSRRYSDWLANGRHAVLQRH